MHCKLSLKGLNQLINVLHVICDLKWFTRESNEVGMFLFSVSIPVGKRIN
jgi:hypothetical protein